MTSTTRRPRTGAVILLSLPIPHPSLLLFPMPTEVAWYPLRADGAIPHQKAAFVRVPVVSRTTLRDVARDEVAADFLDAFGAVVVELALRVGILLADSLRAGTKGSNDGIGAAVLRLALVEVGTAEVTPAAFAVLVTITSVRPVAKTRVSGMLVVVVGVLVEDAGAGFPTGPGGESGGSLSDVCPGGGVYT